MDSKEIRSIRYCQSSHALKITDPNNPVMYLDIKIGEQPIGRVIVELYANIVPKVQTIFKILK
jgi:hypothetical protein